MTVNLTLLVVMGVRAFQKQRTMQLESNLRKLK